MSPGSEVRTDDAEGREEALCLTYGLEPPHHVLAQSRRLMGILTAVVLPLIPAVLDTWHDLSLRRAVAFELIGDDLTRHVPQALQQLAEEPLGSSLVASALDEDVQHVAVLIYCTP